MSALSWFLDPIIQGFGVPGPDNGHSGIDFNVPNDTPLFFPTGGKVVDTSWYAGGGRVAIQVAGTNIIQYFLHLDQINVKVGDTVKANQVVGLSGGGIGDTIMSGSSLIKATAQSQFDGYSSGYHAHFGEVKGGINEYWSSLSNNIDRIDPTEYINTLRANGENAANKIIGFSGDTSVNTATLASNFDINSQINNWFNTIFSNTLQPIIGNLFIISGFIIIAIILATLGITLLTSNISIGNDNSTVDVIHKLGRKK